MLTVSNLARKTNVPLDTVRYYTRIGLLKPARNPANGYKMYNFSDTTRLQFIVAAKDLGFTLAEISHILDEAEHGHSPCPLVRGIIEGRIVENREKINQLKRLQKKMENAMEGWSEMQDSMPNGESVCHLIESFAELKKGA